MKNDNIQIAVLTATYNRKTLLPKLYDSLCKQTSFHFVWYIVDDGSTDDTRKIVNTFHNDHFRVEYIYKENGGKHTALNVGIDHICEDLVLIVDSDDYLTSDAIRTVEEDWHRYIGNDKICGLSYYKVKPDGTLVGDGYPGEYLVDSYANMRINKGVGGDKAEVFRTDVLKKHPFPEYPNERFLSEAIVWNAISQDGYQTVYIGKAIYVCEYLNDGLTQAGKKLRLETPYGTMHHARAFFYKDINLKTRMKYLLYFTAVSIYAKKQKEAIAACEGTAYKAGYIAMYAPGMLLALLWRGMY